MSHPLNERQRMALEIRCPSCGEPPTRMCVAQNLVGHQECKTPHHPRMPGAWLKRVRYWLLWYSQRHWNTLPHVLWPAIRDLYLTRLIDLVLALHKEEMGHYDPLDLLARALAEETRASFVCGGAARSKAGKRVSSALYTYPTDTQPIRDSARYRLLRICELAAASSWNVSAPGKATNIVVQLPFVTPPVYTGAVQSILHGLLFEAATTTPEGLHWLARHEKQRAYRGLIPDLESWQLIALDETRGQGAPISNKRLNEYRRRGAA